MNRLLCSIGWIVFLPVFVAAQPQASETKQADKQITAMAQGLRLRLIGPAVTSGRVIDFAVHPKDRSQYYVAAACGGVWKTTNAGTTWTPVFDNEGSYSIGVVVLDPKNPSMVWVGTGENNSQRSVAYGDGVYRSDDGGKSWKNMGLKASEHIGKIVIDPRNSNVVYVAAQGPLWGPGGDRGLYKTTDGGKTWNRVLFISENTGVTDLVMDPRNPDVLIAASYQRRRHVWTLINGGPESAIYKSTDGGATWNKLRGGLPTEDMGRIGLAMAPTNPDMVYAIIEAGDKKGGIFRTTDLGQTWERRNEYDPQAQYYSHVFIDPTNAERIYVMGVYVQVSDDGGKTLRGLGGRFAHVDNHVIWVDPRNPNYYLLGCDGGIYESFDRAASWHFKSNLPITQFYDIAVDNNGPFYHVYGGTQDNFTLGGPAKTKSVHGITNGDWFVTQGGDGFQSRVDPRDPNIVYSEMQYGGLVRFDRRTGESVGIQPQPGKGEMSPRWNWDSPLIISPHSHTRIYFGANKLYRSEDRGDTWRAISGDLTRQLDRDKLPVMGKTWGPDAVSKHVSTSLYGNLVALAESPKKEDLLYVGTDDGLIQVTHDAGKSWKKYEKFPGVPDRTYVSRLLASLHGANTVYASFDNHKNADFAPYLLKSTDAGETWTSIKGDLPANGPVLAIAEDHVNPNLLFVGTEFGLFFTINGGQKWHRLKSGLPTIAVRDLAIQRQMDDLVVGTFGRGMYVLDDYSPLRTLHTEGGEGTPALLAIKDALMYIPTRQFGLRGKAFLGASFYTADNPPFGAVFTYYLPEALKTLKQQRRDAEKSAAKKPGDLSYPSKDQLRAEDEEEAPAIILEVRDSSGTRVRTLTGPTAQGLHRVAWDLRDPSASLPRPRPAGDDEDVFAPEPGGPLVMPGTYTVTLQKRVGGVAEQLTSSQSFQVVVEGTQSLNPADRKILSDFQKQVAKLQRAAAGTLEAANAVAGRLDQIKRAIDQTPKLDAKWQGVARDLEKRNREILRALRGDNSLRARNENTPMSIVERIEEVVRGQRLSLSKPTQTHRDAERIASEELAELSGKLHTLVETDLKALERALDQAGAPWTPGRLPEWK